MPQKTIFSDILVILAVFALIFMGYSTYSMNAKAQNYIKRQTGKTKVGMDNELSAVVDSLEKALIERSKLKFYANTDPLDLTKVIVKIPPEIIEKQEKEMEQQERKHLLKKNELKLNATIISKQDNSAVFFYKGKNIRLKEGDKIDNKKVISITDGSVIVNENGVKKVYTTK